MLNFSVPRTIDRDSFRFMNFSSDSSYSSFGPVALVAEVVWVAEIREVLWRFTSYRNNLLSSVPQLIEVRL